jgi:hypothetical protein
VGNVNSSANFLSQVRSAQHSKGSLGLRRIDLHERRALKQDFKALDPLSQDQVLRGLPGLASELGGDGSYQVEDLAERLGALHDPSRLGGYSANQVGEFSKNEGVGSLNRPWLGGSFNALLSEGDEPIATATTHNKFYKSEGADAQGNYRTALQGFVGEFDHNDLDMTGSKKKLAIIFGCNTAAHQGLPGALAQEFGSEGRVFIGTEGSPSGLAGSPNNILDRMKDNPLRSISSIVKEANRDARGFQWKVVGDGDKNYRDIVGEP